MTGDNAADLLHKVTDTCRHVAGTLAFVKLTGMPENKQGEKCLVLNFLPLPFSRASKGFSYLTGREN